MEVGCQAARAGRDAVPVEVNNFDIDVSTFIFPMLREGTYLASQTTHWRPASLRYVRTFYFRNIVFHLSKHIRPPHFRVAQKPANSPGMFF